MDCDNIIVNLMTEEKRKELDLETHWSNVGYSSDSALQIRRARGETGLVEDEVNWEDDFGEEAMKAAARAREEGGADKDEAGLVTRESPDRW